MRRARKLMAVASSAALVGAGSLLMATPAQAALVPVSLPGTGCSAQATVSVSASGGDTLTITGLNADCGFVFIPKTSVPVVTASTVSLSGGGTLGTPQDTGNGAWDIPLNSVSASSTLTVVLDSSPTSSLLSFRNQGCCSVNLDTSSGGGGGGGGGSASASSAVPQTFELSLTPTDGTTCTTSSQSGSAGTWINLPSASDCTPPASKSNATLLGWATSPDFPVAIAQRQVDNGWGAYETFDDAGQLTGVFIPAGGATLVSAAGNLYAVWSE